LKVEYDEPLSNFAFNFNLCLYTLFYNAPVLSAVVATQAGLTVLGNTAGRCRLTPCCPGLTALGFSA